MSFSGDAEDDKEDPAVDLFAEAFKPAADVDDDDDDDDDAGDGEGEGVRTETRGNLNTISMLRGRS